MHNLNTRQSKNEIKGGYNGKKRKIKRVQKGFIYKK